MNVNPKLEFGVFSHQLGGLFVELPVVTLGGLKGWCWGTRSLPKSSPCRCVAVGLGLEGEQICSLTNVCLLRLVCTSLHGTN